MSAKYSSDKLRKLIAEHLLAGREDADSVAEEIADEIAQLIDDAVEQAADRGAAK